MPQTHASFIDLISALDMYVDQGNWEKALETAATHGPEVLHKVCDLFVNLFVFIIFFCQIVVCCHLCHPSHPGWKSY